MISIEGLCDCDFPNEIALSVTGPELIKKSMFRMILNRSIEIASLEKAY